jgi:hypothetical protein
MRNFIILSVLCACAIVSAEESGSVFKECFEKDSIACLQNTVRTENKKFKKKTLDYIRSTNWITRLPAHGL